MPSAYKDLTADRALWSAMQETLQMKSSSCQLLQEREKLVLLQRSARKSVIKLQQDIEEMQKLQDKLTDFVKNADNIMAMTTAPIQRLPNDVLLEICCEAGIWTAFEEEEIDRCSFDSPVWIFSQVCQRWRALTLSTPSLWTHIEAYTKYSEGCFRALTSRALAFILPRSRDLPLYIKIRGIDIKACNLEAFFSASVRWARIDLTAYGDGMFQFNDLNQRPSFSQLKEASIFSVDKEFVGCILQAPMLSRVTIEGNGFLEATHWTAPDNNFYRIHSYPQVKVLVLKTEAPLHFLMIFPNIAELDIRRSVYVSRVFDIPLILPQSCHTLKIHEGFLSLWDATIHLRGPHLRGPHVKHLILWGFRSWSSDIPKAIGKLFADGSALRTLTVEYAKEMDPVRIKYLMMFIGAKVKSFVTCDVNESTTRLVAQIANPELLR
jgi:hypothetical protein